jgi:hypothetical protein
MIEHPEHWGFEPTPGDWQMPPGATRRAIEERRRIETENQRRRDERRKWKEEAARGPAPNFAERMEKQKPPADTTEGL